MPFKDLLVYLDDSRMDAKRLELSLDLARAHDANLTALYVGRFVTDGLMLDAPPTGVLVETLEEERQLRLSAARSVFDSVTGNSGLRCEFRAEDGDPVYWLGLHGRYADLIIVGQPGRDDDPFGGGGIAGAVALSSGRPVLMIPRAGAQSLLAERVIVAWNGSREATRAANDAMPLLTNAVGVEVLSLGAAPNGDNGELGADGMSRHLARHGVPAQANNLPLPNSDPADAFLSHANRFGAGMVVMGAYGHSRLREFVLGGMTRHLLNHSHIPLFLSH